MTIHKDVSGCKEAPRESAMPRPRSMGHLTTPRLEGEGRKQLLKIGRRAMWEAHLTGAETLQGGSQGSEHFCLLLGFPAWVPHCEPGCRTNGCSSATLTAFSAALTPNPKASYPIVFHGTYLLTFYILP